MKIVFLDASTVGEDVSLAPIESLGAFTVYPFTRKDEVEKRIIDAEVVIVNKVRLFQTQIDAAPKLRLICVAATGTDNVDSAYAQSKGIAVKNVVGYSTDSVAQITFAHIFSLVNHIEYFNHYVHSGEYTRSKIYSHHGQKYTELKGKRLGIIGMGNIGQRVAQIATVLGMQVSYFSTSGTGHCKDYPSVGLEELLHHSDIVSINAPMNTVTNNLITLDKLKMMKSTALIINMGRGGIINEADLAEALNTGVIAGAGVDVFTREPILEDHPYYTVKDKERLLLTPHIAWASVEARTLLIQRIAENIAAANL